MHEWPRKVEEEKRRIKHTVITQWTSAAAHNDKMCLITAVAFPELIIAIHFLDLDVVFMFGQCTVEAAT